MIGRLHRKCWIALSILCVAATGVCTAAGARIEPVNLRCEYLEKPLGLDTPAPRFFWELQAAERDQGQTAFQIIVADSEKLIAKNKSNQWDSGKVSSGESIQIAYAGQPLRSGGRYFWKVRVWDGRGKASKWSPAATFEMGLLRPADWAGAQWIGQRAEAVWREAWKNWKEQVNHDKLDFNRHGIWEIKDFFWCPIHPASLLRKEFTIEKPIESGRAYVCGLGYYELYINGQKVGDRVLDPAWTRYDVRQLYSTYDITNLLKPGRNAVGVMLGRGWYQLIQHDMVDFDKTIWTGQPKCILKLDLRHGDGSSEQIVTDTSWKGADGPVVFDCVRVGEIYDASKEKPGWDQPQYTESGWLPVWAVPSPGGALSSEVMPPIRVVETVPPASMTSLGDGKYRYAMPFAMAGWARIKVQGPEGRRVLIKFAERLNADGTIDEGAGAGRPQQASYVMKGTGEETYEPHFAYYGFQYIQVEGCDKPPTVEGRWVHSDVERVGKFQCSNPMINKLQENIERTVLNNLHSIPTDCPHREKLGWMGDSHTMALSNVQNFDMALFYENWVRDMADMEGPEGQMPSVVPNISWPWGWGDSPTWVGTYLITPWVVYRHYGDRRLLETYYDGLKMYVDSIKEHAQREEKAPEYIIKGMWGDWFPPHATEDENPATTNIYGTSYFYLMADIMSHIAEVLGKTEDAAHFAQLAENVKEAMNKAYFNPNDNSYPGYKSGDFLQSTSAIPLSMGMVPKENEKAVLNRLVEDIMVRRGGHLDTGLLATKALMESLADLGRPDVAWALACQTTYPSWGWQILNGATNIWERWDGNDSRMHPMYGVPSQFFFRTLAGIRTEADAYKRIRIAPYVPDDLTSATASIHTVRGLVASSWRRMDGSLNMQVEIPANTTAEVRVPVFGWKNFAVYEGGRPVWENGRASQPVDGIHKATQQADSIALEVGGGCYQFELRKH